MPISGPIRTEWLDDGRTMRLLESVTYTAPDGVEWYASKNELIDGASIPRFLWRAVGCPFVGKYRIASVFHDVACHCRDRSHEQTHKMFLSCMLECGVSRPKAHIMYRGVCDFGPRWNGDGVVLLRDGSPFLDDD